jgi:glyoxylase-like metal-dependent hydrolase (beta-lactamase superfamily II)
MSRPLKLQLLRVGKCRHLECLVARSGRLSLVDFPALCGLIRHPERGWILYDTGYSKHFFEATASWPERLIRTVLPVELPPGEHLLTQLHQAGITPADIGLVIVSHYHGDHIAGLKDFPNATFLALKADTQRLEALRGRPWRSTLKAQFHALLPTDFFQRLRHADDAALVPLPGWMTPFTLGLDLLGDGSLLGIALPGHSAGQMGVFLPDAGGRPVFLVGDACWSLPACREGRLPSVLTRLVNADSPQYGRTFLSLQQLAVREPAVALLPSHCNESWRAFCDER